jgi:glyoxylate reductase
MMGRVYVTRTIAPEAIEMLRADHEVEIWPEDRAIPRPTLLQKVADADALLCIISERIDDEVLARAPRLRIVANMAVGYDNVDVAACTRRVVIATNTPGVLTETTADLTFGLIIAVGRQLMAAERFVRQGQWKTWEPSLFIGRDVHHATLGIVGLGRIGAELAKRARGFDMRVLYAGRQRKPDLEAQLGVEFATLDDLLAQSDYVSINVALTPETRKLIGAAQLARMRPEAFLINAARGPIVDTEALYEACRSGRIAGAALDVTDPEPLPADHPLVGRDDVIVIPHIGSNTLATRVKMGRMCSENLLAALRGERMPWVIDPSVYG